MAVTDQHSTDQHATQHPMDPHRVDPHGSDPLGEDPDREPSADWGWHGSFPVAGPVVGWFTAFALFVMLIGNRESQVSSAFLIGFGAILVVMLIGHHVNAWKAKRR